MDENTPRIEVRAVHIGDASAIHRLDYNFETDRIYTLRVKEQFQEAASGGGAAFSFELVETVLDRPLYKEYFEDISSAQELEELKERLRRAGGGYVALADGKVAGAILLDVEEWRSVARIQDLFVGHQYRRYGIGTLLLQCATDWARERGCWAILLEAQNVNYPAIQFYLHNGLAVWGISRNFYPPGSVAHEVAIFMGKRLSPQIEG